jgi:hypothetical protein
VQSVTSRLSLSPKPGWWMSTLPSILHGHSIRHITEKITDLQHNVSEINQLGGRHGAFRAHYASAVCIQSHLLDVPCSRIRDRSLLHLPSTGHQPPRKVRAAPRQQGLSSVSYGTYRHTWGTQPKHHNVIQSTARS